jgi:transcriptional regulator with XRE-family HTH domain
MAEASDFTQWLRATVTAAGFDLDKGGVRAFATAAGTDPGQTSRALSGKTRKPSIEYLSAWTAALRVKGSPVTMRDMLVRSGWVAPEELPAAEVVAPSAHDVDLAAVARQYGVPADRTQLFVASVEAVAKTFADEAEGDNVGNSQTGGLSAKR